MPRDEGKHADAPRRSSRSRTSSGGRSSSGSAARGPSRPKIKDIWVKLLETQKRAKEAFAARERRAWSGEAEAATVEAKGEGEDASKNKAAEAERAAAEAAERALPPQATESTILFVGCSGAGKSTIVSQFLDPSKDPGDPKPTVALEYLFGRRTTSSSKQVVHLWELGGGARLKELISVPVNPSTLPRSAVCLVLDGGSVARSWAALETWLDVLRPHGRDCLAKMRGGAGAGAEGAARAEALAARRLPAAHPDRATVRPLPVPLVVVVSRADLMDDIAPADRRLFLQAVRHAAHAHGASLATWSRRDKQAAANLRGLLNTLAFGSEPKRAVQLDPGAGKPLIAPAGSDAFSRIGAPEGERAEDFAAMGVEVQRRAWVRALGRSFDLQVSAEAERREEHGRNQHLEPIVDAMVAQKREELLQYRREAERRARLAAADKAASKKKKKKKKPEAGAPAMNGVGKSSSK
jgi:dynein light intermediate chain 2